MKWSVNQWEKNEKSGFLEIKLTTLERLNTEVESGMD